MWDLIRSFCFSTTCHSRYTHTLNMDGTWLHRMPTNERKNDKNFLSASNESNTSTWFQHWNPNSNQSGQTKIGFFANAQAQLKIHTLDYISLSRAFIASIDYTFCHMINTTQFFPSFFCIFFLFFSVLLLEDFLTYEREKNFDLSSLGMRFVVNAFGGCCFFFSSVFLATNIVFINLNLCARDLCTLLISAASLCGVTKQWQGMKCRECFSILWNTLRKKKEGFWESEAARNLLYVMYNRFGNVNTVVTNRRFVLWENEKAETFKKSQDVLCI